LNLKQTNLKFGTIGLKAKESGILNSRQIEAARQAIVRKLKRKGKVWIKIFPDLPITKNQQEFVWVKVKAKFLTGVQK
jgi:large subunit ribosomal protein L16